MKAIAQMLRDVRKGKDFPAISALIGRMRVEDAEVQLPGQPYSILTYVAHTAFWQDLWLAQIRGEKRPSIIDDWRVPDPEEWPAVRQRLFDGLDEAIEIAETSPMPHKMKSEVDAQQALCRIAVHLSYHVGQIKTLKRGVAEAKKASRSG